MTKLTTPEITDISIPQLLIAVSGALDSIHPALQMHQKRTALIACRLANALGLSSENYRKVFYAALIHDLGALGLKERIDLLNFEEQDADLHAIMGAALLKESKIFEDISDVVKFHHKPWVENGISEKDTLELANLIHLSDRIEVLCHQDNLLAHAPDIKNKISSSTAFNNKHVAAFLTISQKDAFWFELAPENLNEMLMEVCPKETIKIGALEADGLGEFISLIVDTRSRFTARHSSGVAICAATISKLLNLPQKTIDTIKMAGYLHDIGKLAIPTELLEKPGALTDEERALIKSHVYKSYQILRNIEGLEKVTEIAVMHHERKNGSGYPFGKNQSDLTIPQQIMAIADVFTALAENRPYRTGLNQAAVLDILKKEVHEGLLDAQLFDVLKNNYAYIHDLVSRTQDASEKQLSEFWTLPNHLNKK